MEKKTEWTFYSGYIYLYSYQQENKLVLAERRKAGAEMPIIQILKAFEAL